MIDFILTAKHWKIFFLLMFIPFALMMFSSFFIGFAQLISDGSNLFTTLLSSLNSLLSMAILIWFWSVGKGLQKYIPQNINVNDKFFKLAMTYLIVTWPLETIISFIFQIARSGDSTSLGLSHALEFAITFVISIASLVAGIYLCVHIAKSLIIAETQEDTDSKEYIGTFILCLLLPIGIWFVQPRINDLVEADYE